MKKINECRLVFPARSVNEGFARAVCAAFASLADPTVEELSDLRTAVSEAVTNAVVHGYRDEAGKITVDMALFDDGTLKIKVKDKGVGIEDVKRAREPLFTTAGGERSGLGFTVMESFSDRLTVRSAPGKGTAVTIVKVIKGRA